MLEKSKLQKMSNDLIELLVKKGSDYGDSYFLLRKEYGATSFLIRLADKFYRLKELSKKEALVNESIEDTLNDIIGYCMLELYYRSEEKNNGKLEK